MARLDRRLLKILGGRKEVTAYQKLKLQIEKLESDNAELKNRMEREFWGQLGIEDNLLKEIDKRVSNALEKIADYFGVEMNKYHFQMGRLITLILMKKTIKEFKNEEN